MEIGTLVMLVRQACNARWFWQAALFSFFMELGSKSFFLTAIFTIWCPFYGGRAGAGSLMQQGMVVLGAVSALSLHALIFFVPDYMRIRLSWSLSLLASVTQAALGFQAFSHLHESDGDRQPPLLPVTMDGVKAESAWRKEAVLAEKKESGQRWLLGSFQAYDPQAYGAINDQTIPEGTSTNPFNENEAQQAFRATNSGASGFMAAFVVPFICIFMVEPGAEAIGTLEKAASTFPVSVGLAGCAGALILASVLGFFLERHMSERRLLFAAVLGLWCLWLVTTSQDVVLLCGNRLFDQTNPTPLPAGLFTKVRPSFGGAKR